jgi:class 3 adenylate cyclase
MRDNAGMTPTVLVCEPRRTPLRIQLGPDPIEVGRECSGLLITDGQVSRRHLELHRDGDTVVVVDLGSTNGTRVDEVPFTGAHRLRPGEVIRLGATTITLVEPSEGSHEHRPLSTTSIDLVSDTVLSAPESFASLVSHDRTVTIVFSDIQDSTHLAVELGDEQWMARLQVHNAIVRRGVARHGGHEVKTLGDGFMLTFPSARAAVLAMCEVQQAIDEYARSKPTEAISVRVGIHTGEAMPELAGDLIGRHVILASRIANAARGGEILVSTVVFEIATGRGDIHFGEPRTVALKGIAAAQVVHPVNWR